MSFKEAYHVLNKVEKVLIKLEFKQIMYKHMPNEFNENDDDFFAKYAGKKVNVYNWLGDWWICEDDNTPITSECFEQLNQQK